MARKTKASSNKDAGRSTAGLFKDLDGISAVQSNTHTKPASETESEDTQTPEKGGMAEDDDPYLYPFPFNFIYATQDFLNDNIDLRKGAQLLLLVYLLQLLYLAEEDLVWVYLERIAMNYAGIMVGMVFSYNLRWKKYLAGTGEQPKLPEFNLIYAVLIPNLLSLKFDCNVIENLTYNYFVIENIPIIAKAFSSIVYFSLYGDGNAQVYFQKAFLFVFLSAALNYINEGNEEHLISKEVANQEIDYDLVQVNDDKIKSGLNTSLSKTEIHLFLVAIVNLVFNLKTSNVYIIIFQKLIISLILGLLLTYPVFKLNKTVSLVVFAGIFYFFTDFQLQPILDENPVLWLINLIQEPANYQLFTAWVGILVVAILIIFNLNLEFNFRRKVWHFLILATVLPSYLVNKSFTMLGLLGALIVLILVEVLRANKITIVGEIIHDKLYRFQDFKDLKGPLNLSYIYLLIGIGFPIILHELVQPDLKSLLFPTEATYDVKQFIGLISLGLGDSIASIIGKRFGRIKYSGCNKTLEGSLGFLGTNLGAFYYLTEYLNLPAINGEVLFVTNLLASVFEGVTTMNDNIFIPVMIYIIWEVLEKTV